MKNTKKGKPEIMNGNNTNIVKEHLTDVALQQEVAAQINREAEILRGSQCYQTISNFIEYYGILYVLRVFAQAVADRFKDETHYKMLVKKLCDLYSTYSTLAIQGDKLAK